MIFTLTATRAIICLMVATVLTFFSVIAHVTALGFDRAARFMIELGRP